MNILFVNEIPMNPLYGGIERVTDLLTKELISRTGYNVFYLCSRIDNEGMLDYEFPAKQLSLPYDGGFENEDNLRFYKDCLIDNKIDIVVNQRGWAPFMNNALNMNGIPTISVIHCIPKGAHVIYMAEILRHNKTFDGIWRYVLKLCIYPLYYAYKYYKSINKLKSHYSFLVSNTSAVVLLSKKCNQEFDEIVKPFSPQCITCSIPNPNTYLIPSDDTFKKENIVLFVGRLSANEKNPMRLLKVWEKIYKSHKEWKLIFVGEGDALDDMKSYILNRNLERVEFHGRRPDVDDYYRKADFICLTSNFEGWGMTLTEGMSFGCIPFTFDNYGAASEIIDDGVNGCLIPPFDLKIYSGRLSELMCNEQRRTCMSRSAMKKVKSFNISVVGDKWDELFSKVCKEDKNY